MATTFSGGIKLTATGLLTKDSDLGSLTYTLNYAYSKAMTNGTGADQANMVWTDTRTISASGTDDLDLAGVLTDAFGATITFTKIKGMIVVAASGNTNDVVVGGDASAALVNWVGNANDVVNVKPGGLFAAVAPNSAGYAVTATTGDILQIANSSSSTSVTYDIILIGTV
jgi:hypothetical protein